MAEVIDENWPIHIVSTGLKDILVPIDTAANLEKLVPDRKAISAISQNKEVVGIHAFSLIDDEDLTAVCRNFAPLYGIDEEAATGTANCALACYLYKNGIKRNPYIFEQGHNLNSISQIYVNIKSESSVIMKSENNMIEKNERNTITKVYVGGYGYLICKKTFSI